METTITSRRGDVPEEIRDRAVLLLEKLARKARRPLRAEAIFDADHHQKVVELHMTVARGSVKVSSAEADDYRTALDRAVDKLGNQLDKAFTRRSRRAASE